MNQRNQGFSLIAVLVGFAILSGVVFLLLQITSAYNFGQSRLERGVSVYQVLAATSADLQKLGFDVLNATCAQPSPTPCSKVLKSATALNSPTNATIAKNLGVRRNWNGDLAASGLVCVEITSCTTLASSSLLDVLLTGSYVDADPNAPLRTKTYHFRSTPW